MGKPRLCEIIAVVSGKKGEAEKAVTDTYHKFQKPELFDGISRSYTPRKDSDEQLPSEAKSPQFRVADLVAGAAATWNELIDLTTTLDAGNCQAKADVVVDGQVLAQGVPVTTLLFLEKQLGNMKAFVTKIPTPDAAEAWVRDEQQDMLASMERKTARTKKVQEPLVLFPATAEHPAQTQLITKDVIAGDWAQRLYTTRLPASEKNEMLVRVSKLLDAVKVARERANGIEVEKQKIGAALTGYVFGALATARDGR